MISKLVAYSSHDRQGSLDALRVALDQYAICGVIHNMSFVSELLRHPDFKAGATPTNFIPKHYPSGFHGIKLSQDELCEFTAIAYILLAGPIVIPNEDIEKLVICIDGMFGKAFHVERTTLDHSLIFVRPLAPDGTFMDDSLSRHVHIENITWDSISPIAHVIIQGYARAIQVRITFTSERIHYYHERYDLLILTTNALDSERRHGWSI
jgi:hypothetical protein